MADFPQIRYAPAMAIRRFGVARRAAITAGLFALAAVLPLPGVVPAAAEPAAQNKPPPTRLPSLPSAVIDDALEIGGDEIAAKKVETRMSVAVRIDGRGPFPFIVDSGADTTALSSLLANRLGLAKGTPATLHSMTGVGPVERVRVGELGLGESRIRNLELPVLRQDDLGAPGLIGIDALVEQRLMMDFDRKVITIEDARRPPPRRMEGEVVVVAKRRRGQLILTQVGVNGRPVEAVLDTGSEITIGNGALRAALEKRHRGRIETIDVLGVNGVIVKMQLIRLAEIRVGSIVIRDVPIAFADVPPFVAFSLDDHPSILLGTDLMANFRRVSLDFRARKVRFQLKTCGGISVIVSTTAQASRIAAAEPNGPVCR